MKKITNPIILRQLKRTAERKVQESAVASKCDQENEEQLSSDNLLLLEKRRLKTQLWKKAHPDRVRAQERRYYHKNRDKINAQRRVYYASHKEKMQRRGREAYYKMRARINKSVAKDATKNN